MKKLIFSFVFIIAVFTGHASTLINGIYYELNNDTKTAIVVQSKNYSGNIDIPSTVSSDGITYTVTSIGHNAFYKCSSLTSVTIPNSVTSIGYSAFEGCSSLTSVTIPNSVTSIGHSAFEGCSSLTSVTIPNSVTSIGGDTFYQCSSLTSVTIPNSVISIGYSAFEGCSSLTSVTIPNSVTSIGSRTFFECSSLTSVIIPNSVTSIGIYAFVRCSKMTSITIGSNITSIGQYAFYDCNNLSKVNVSNLSAWCDIYFENEYSNPLFYTHSIYLDNELIKDLVIPEDVKEIRDYAFYHCDSLTSVSIPNTVTNIGSYAFDGCKADIFAMRINGYYSGIDWFATNHLYCFSYLTRGTTNGKYQYDVPTVKIFPNGIKLEKLLLRNYNDEILSYDILGVDDETSLSCFCTDNNIHRLYYVMHMKNNGDIKGCYLFKSPKLSLTTLNPKVVNNGEVIVAAETNMMDNTPEAGFEWRKTDAPDVVTSKKGEAVVFNGKMEGIIKNLDVSSYYKYRPYYNSVDGKVIYGNWIGFDPSDFSYFEPTVYTYDYVEVVDGTATFVGYALQGSDEIIEQGFEYWKEGTVNNNALYAPNNDITTVIASGQLMTAKVNGLFSEAIYNFRAFVKTSKGTTYGDVCNFTMPFVSGVEVVQSTNGSVIRNGIYNLSGVKIAESLQEARKLPKGIYIVNGKKMIVK